MSTNCILLGIVCLIVIGCSTEPRGGVLKKTKLGNEGANGREGKFLIQDSGKSKDQDAKSSALRSRLLNIAGSQLGVREATGHNDGVIVEEYLNITGLPKGNPWCAAFVSWVFAKAGFVKPRTAWSPALFPLAKQTALPQQADVLGIYSIRLKRIAHAGLVERRQNNWIIAIEGNTNADGGREGDGVYRKWRHIKTIAKFADWVR